MWANIIYIILIIIKYISIVVLTFLFQKQIDDLNNQINDLKYQNFALATKLFSIENDKNKSLEKCEKTTKSN